MAKSKGITPTVEEVLESPVMSFWFKDALRSALQRDCVDAAHEAQALADILSHRADVAREIVALLNEPA